ncbi:HD domain-containing phosphohydrolase [Marinomonas algicola]|uniref:HD domain-containing phosphohydrolase n=1 Tax=Marinomonas algicola TaxID=2773454 RepID=UPI00174EB668|nr:HD domain-containing phosphohydrolase [Marinomonas algicola]
MKNATKGISVQLLVSSVIVLCMLMLAVFLTTQSFFSNRDVLVSHVEDSAKHVAKTINLQLEQVTHPIQNTIQLLELDPITTLDTLEQRLDRLPVLFTVLKSLPILSSVYVGYENGDFFLLRHLKPKAKSQLNAPSRASFLLQSIENNTGHSTAEPNWLFYDENLVLIETRHPKDYQYDPRLRPWFQKAQRSEDIVVTTPYVFFTTQEAGITVALKNNKTRSVVGLDASIKDFSSIMQSLQPSEHTVIALTDPENNVIGYPITKDLIKSDNDGLRLAKLDELQQPALSFLADHKQPFNTLIRLNDNNNTWFGIKIDIDKNQATPLSLLFAVKEADLFEKSNRHLITQIKVSLIVILVLLLFGWILGLLISRPLKRLANEVNALGNFDFSHTIAVNSFIKEVNTLAKSTQKMASTIREFQSISKELARDPDLEKMLAKVLSHLVSITECKGGAVYLRSKEATEFALTTTHNTSLLQQMIRCKSLENKDIQDEFRLIFNQEDKASLFIIPLLDRQDKLLGVLVLLDKKHMLRDDSFQRFVQEVSGAVGTAIETRNNIESQNTFIDSIVKLLADAVDEKSHHTGNHCKRVPTLAEMMINAAEKTEAGPYKRFKMSKQEKREFHIGAWLHDCGKIITPEHIVDKSTKLEALYNRIHEIRTRFDVLWRDAEIEYLKGRLDHQNEAHLLKKKNQTQDQLKQDFEFISQANIGSENFSKDGIERLKTISQKTWWRHFDASMGLSRAEKERLPMNVERLPALEKLLDDKPEHLILWNEKRPPVEKDNPNNVWGFDMELPEYENNLGELYNLSVKHGTLTTEQRFTINDHSVQTIRMLSTLPLPDDLKRVPDIAGNHHERVDGKGYPRRLKAGELSVAEKIMTIADVFEALTSADRPYKEAKTLSESLGILASMVKNQHIDKETFYFFIESEVYLDYAKSYLKPQQIDFIDKQKILKKSE